MAFIGFTGIKKLGPSQDYRHTIISHNVKWPIVFE